MAVPVDLDYGRLQHNAVGVVRDDTGAPRKKVCVPDCVVLRSIVDSERYYYCYYYYYCYCFYGREAEEAAVHVPNRNVDRYESEEHVHHVHADVAVALTPTEQEVAMIVLCGFLREKQKEEDDYHSIGVAWTAKTLSSIYQNPGAFYFAA